MNFDFSDEQKLLQEQARRLLSDADAIGAARREMALPGGAEARALWGRIVRQGWTSAAISEDAGGLGLTPYETCIIAEELGRTLAPVPFASTLYFLAEALAASGALPDLLRGVAEGRVIGCLAHCEGRADGSETRCEARGGVLFGRKLPVVDGDRATHALVTAHVEGGRDDQVSLFVVALDQPCVARTPIRLLDRTRRGAEIRFDGAEAQLLFEDGAAALEALYARAAVYIAFEQLGLAERCLETARDYALQRTAFGHPIGRYQAIKHKLADVFVAIEIARSNAYYGAWALTSDAPELPIAAASARIAATHAAWLAARESIQVHGGIGVTWEMDCHLYYRRAQLLETIAGGVDAWRQKLAARLIASSASPS